MFQTAILQAEKNEADINVIKTFRDTKYEIKAIPPSASGKGAPESNSF
jgi:hypothetical protein